MSDSNNNDALDDPTAVTLDHYQRNAVSFDAGTRDHDVSQNIDALLSRIKGEPPFTILDFGCGPGRDLKTLRELGHTAIGLEGAAAFIPLAEEYSGCEVWHQNFVALDLPDAHFDGIFANASLFHVPRAELPGVLQQLYATLKPRGVLFSSNPRGQNQEGVQHGRYGAFYDVNTWRAYVDAAGFEELTHYYRPPGKPRDQQPWLATVWRRPG